MNETACNFNSEANVDDASCFYVAQGAIAGAQTATDMTTETYSYDGNAEYTYDWAVTGGSIQGESSGVGLLSVDVMWSSTGNGLVTVTETDTTGCSGDVVIEVDLLVNSIGELEMMGMVRVTDAEDAQRDIIRQARKLQDAGEIILASADGGGFV